METFSPPKFSIRPGSVNAALYVRAGIHVRTKENQLVQVFHIDLVCIEIRTVYSTFKRVTLDNSLLQNITNMEDLDVTRMTCHQILIPIIEHF